LKKKFSAWGPEKKGQKGRQRAKLVEGKKEDPGRTGFWYFANFPKGVARHHGANEWGGKRTELKDGVLHSPPQKGARFPRKNKKRNGERNRDFHTLPIQRSPGTVGGKKKQTVQGDKGQDISIRTFWFAPARSGTFKDRGGIPARK